MSRSQIEITGFAKSGGPLTKRITVAADGSLHSDGSACVMSSGCAYRLQFDTLDGFAACIAGLNPNEAIALGALRDDLSERVEVTTRERLSALNGTAASDFIARTGNHIFYRPDEPALALIDFDTKGMPAAVRATMDQLGGFLPALMSVLPELATAGRVVRPSTSSGITRTDTGQAMPGSNGVHLFVLVQNGADIERFLKTLHARCWLLGLGWMMVGAGGQLLERSIVDRTVAGPERLVFEAPPILEPSLEQDPRKRAPIVVQGDILDARAACSDLTIVERARLRELRAADVSRMRPEAGTARAAFVKQQAARIVERSGRTLAAAQQIVERQCAGVLLPAVVLHFDDVEHEGATVGAVLADPDRFIGATLADPLEGPAYGRCKAKIMQRPDDTVWINSFAHGRATYELNYDAASVETALRNGDRDEAANTLVKLLLAGDIAPDEEQRLRELVIQLSGVMARPLAAKIKAARAEQKRQRAAAKREHWAAARTDSRVKLPAPLPDAELLPIARAIDDVLHAAKLAEPPTRDLDLWPVELRAREAFRLHGMTTRETPTPRRNTMSDEPSEPAMCLPPPQMWLLTPHDKFSMEYLIETHIEFVEETEEGERSVALHPKFVEHYMHYRSSKLPVIGAVVTNPLVLADGTLLAPDGLDRQRRVVFKIEPALRDLLPEPDHCTPATIARAMHFLIDEWLVDVATDFAGKCVLISAAMTILERTLLPERPAFFVTAGQRGGGKTTVLMMLFLAACGHTPPACAWSQQEEERRKALFSYLGEGVPAVVWDNIPRGLTVSCPSIEKSLTAETYSDRVLGESRIRTVPAFTIIFFTGNNIAPRGDMASRSLNARLAVGRPDPENREFKHPDPIAWTEAHRGNILRALYTVMLGNPRLRAANPGPAETRFKTWWHLIGSAVEHAADLLVDEIKWLTVDVAVEAPTEISFRDIFNVFEIEEEQSSALATVLDVLNSRWTAGFKASDLVSFVGAADEAAINFKAALEQATGKPVQTVTATVITWRLKALVDAPVQVGDRVLVLRYSAERGHGGTFAVSALT